MGIWMNNIGRDVTTDEGEDTQGVKAETKYIEQRIEGEIFNKIRR